MIDYDEIENEIISMEANRDTSYASVSRLAPLYCAMIYKKLTTDASSRTLATARVNESSDFMQAISGKSADKVFPIVDELMDTLAMVNKRVYDSVLAKIRDA